MTDFPQAYGPLPFHVSTYSAWSGLMGDFNDDSMVLASSTWPVANTAYFIPIAIPFHYPVKRVFWANGSSVTSTNMDFGIYGPDGTRLYSTGSTAAAGTSATQYVTPATDFILAPGMYYFALADSSTTANRGGQASAPPIAVCHFVGALEQTSALPLPATATFVTVATAYLPLCGVTRTASGF